MFKIVLSNPRPLGQVAPNLDPRLIALVERAMARDLSVRFQSADEMINALDAYFSGDAAEPPAAPGLPTGNTWAASHADIPKSSSGPALLIAALGVLLLAGGAFAAYQKFGKS